MKNTSSLHLPQAQKFFLTWKCTGLIVVTMLAAMVCMTFSIENYAVGDSVQVAYNQKFLTLWMLFSAVSLVLLFGKAAANIKEISDRRNQHHA